jgi:hypothetical protein
MATPRIIHGIVDIDGTLTADSPGTVQIGGGHLYGSGNVTNAPRMVNHPGFDFRLRGSSPCVDKGVYRAWMAKARDRSGDLRIRGQAVDIGAFEYKPGGSAILVR